MRFSLYQGQVKAPWECPASIFTLHPTLGLSWRLAERPVKFNGVSPVCGSGHMWNQDIVEVDGGGWFLSAQCEESSTQGTNALIFRSFDGYRWDLRSSFPVVSPPGHPVCTSPGENTLVYLANGAGLLLVSRCGNNLPLLGWVSADNGVTWQRFDLPESVRGVMPVAVRTGSGAIVLATGRGGLAMRLNEEGDGKNWTIINIGEAHNRLILHNNKLNGTSLQYTTEFTAFEVTHETTAYNSLRMLGTDNGVLCYDRLSSSDAIPGGSRSWDGPPGNRDANDHLFCMRFQLELMNT